MRKLSQKNLYGEALFNAMIRSPRPREEQEYRLKGKDERLQNMIVIAQRKEYNVYFNYFVYPGSGSASKPYLTKRGWP